MRNYLDRALRLLAASALLSLAAGCAREPHQMSVTIQQVMQFQPGDVPEISHEETGGHIYVSVVDRSRDAHVFLLNHDGMTRQQALEMLGRKQAQLRAAP